MHISQDHKSSGKVPGLILLVCDNAVNGLEILAFLKDSIHEPLQYRLVGATLKELQEINWKAVFLVIMDTENQEITKFLFQVKGDAKTIILSSNFDKGLLLKLFTQGNFGFVLKKSYLPEVQSALENALVGNHYYSNGVASTLLQSMSEKNEETPVIEKKLSDQEKRVLGLICRQFSNREIAATLHLAEYTVMRHKQNIKTKIGARNLVGYVTFAIKHKLIDIDSL